MCVYIVGYYVPVAYKLLNALIYSLYYEIVFLLIVPYEEK